MARTYRQAWQRRGRSGGPRQDRFAAKRLGRFCGLLALAAIVVFGVLREEVSAPQIVSLWQPSTATAVVTSRPFPICLAGARVDCIVDGDTFWFSGEKVRIADMDTPEISSPRCRREFRTRRARQAAAVPADERGAGRAAQVGARARPLRQVAANRSSRRALGRRHPRRRGACASLERAQAVLVRGRLDPSRISRR